MEKGKRTKRNTDIIERARQLRLQAEDLERQVRFARGTAQRTVVSPDNVIVRPARSPYYVGDEGPTEQLMEAVQRMLSDRPWRFSEMVEALGARDNRIKGVIMRLQREGVRVVDVSPEGTNKALWFIPSDEVLDRLTRSRTRRSTMRK